MFLGESPIEEILYSELVKFGFKPVSQYVVGPYRLDLAFPDLKVGIECDGKKWHTDPDQINRDIRRSEYLQSQGWGVVRFPGWMIKKYPRACASMVGLKYLEPIVTAKQKKYLLGAYEIYLIQVGRYINLYEP